MYLKFIYLCWVTTCIRAAPPTGEVPPERQQPTVIPILSLSADYEPHGKFRYSYETGNGIKREETAYDKELPDAKTHSNCDNEGGEDDESDEIHVQKGSYSYTAPDGTLVSVSYIADENGFQPINERIQYQPNVESTLQQNNSGNNKEPATVEKSIKPKNNEYKLKFGDKLVPKNEKLSEEPINIKDNAPKVYKEHVSKHPLMGNLMEKDLSLKPVRANKNSNKEEENNHNLQNAMKKEKTGNEEKEPLTQSKNLIENAQTIKEEKPPKNLSVNKTASAKIKNNFEGNSKLKSEDILSENKIKNENIESPKDHESLPLNKEGSPANRNENPAQEIFPVHKNAHDTKEHNLPNKNDESMTNEKESLNITREKNNNKLSEEKSPLKNGTKIGDSNKQNLNKVTEIIENPIKEDNNTVPMKQSLKNNNSTISDKNKPSQDNKAGVKDEETTTPKNLKISKSNESTTMKINPNKTENKNFEHEINNAAKKHMKVQENPTNKTELKNISKEKPIAKKMTTVLPKPKDETNKGISPTSKSNEKNVNELNNDNPIKKDNNPVIKLNKLPENSHSNNTKRNETAILDNKSVKSKNTSRNDLKSGKKRNEPEKNERKSPKTTNNLKILEPAVTIKPENVLYNKENPSNTSAKGLVSTEKLHMKQKPITTGLQKPKNETAKSTSLKNKINKENEDGLNSEDKNPENEHKELPKNDHSNNTESNKPSIPDNELVKNKNTSRNDLKSAMDGEKPEKNGNISTKTDNNSKTPEPIVTEKPEIVLNNKEIPSNTSGNSPDSTEKLHMQQKPISSELLKPRNETTKGTVLNNKINKESEDGLNNKNSFEKGKNPENKLKKLPKNNDNNNTKSKKPDLLDNKIEESDNTSRNGLNSAKKDKEPEENENTSSKTANNSKKLEPNVTKKPENVSNDKENPYKKSNKLPDTSMEKPGLKENERDNGTQNLNDVVKNISKHSEKPQKKQEELDQNKQNPHNNTRISNTNKDNFSNPGGPPSKDFHKTNENEENFGKTANQTKNSKQEPLNKINENTRGGKDEHIKKRPDNNAKQSNKTKEIPNIPVKNPEVKHSENANHPGINKAKSDNNSKNLENNEETLVDNNNDITKNKGNETKGNSAADIVKPTKNSMLNNNQSETGKDKGKKEAQPNVNEEKHKKYEENSSNNPENTTNHNAKENEKEAKHIVDTAIKAAGVAENAASKAVKAANVAENAADAAKSAAKETEKLAKAISQSKSESRDLAIQSAKEHAKLAGQAAQEAENAAIKADKAANDAKQAAKVAENIVKSVQSSRNLEDVSKLVEKSGSLLKDAENSAKKAGNAAEDAKKQLGLSQSSDPSQVSDPNLNSPKKIS